MQSHFSARQTFLVAAGAGLAVALAPIGVDAAKRTARALAVDKKGRAQVVVANRPSVKVRGGVKVANEPNVRVPGGVAVTNRPTVDIGNQPTVTVSNQPAEMAVSAAPGRLNATTRPPLDDVFNVFVPDVNDVDSHEILTLPGSRGAAITHLSASVRKFGSPVVAATIFQLVRYVRASGSNSCGQAGWTPTVLRRLTMKTDETLVVDLGASPIVIRPDDQGRAVCVVLRLYQWVNDTRVDLAADGYTF